MSDDTTRVPFKFDGLPDTEGFTSWQDALKGLLGKLFVDIPSSITNVKISEEAPTDSETNYLWGKRDSAGNFLGFAIFAQGDWRLIAAPTPPDSLFLISGDSTNPPVGFSVVDSSMIGSSNLVQLQETWNPPGDGLVVSEGPWTLFHVKYTGF